MGRKASSGSERVTALHRARLVLHRVGVDVQRYPPADGRRSALRTFLSNRPDVILDVGAHQGGFARELREVGYRGLIDSFEPGSAAFQMLERATHHDSQWSAHRIACGDRNADTTLHVAGNRGASSSVLEMLPTHTRAARESAYVATESVSMVRLDDWVGQAPRDWYRPALKIDAQGSEEAILKGAPHLLDQLVGLQLELSFVPLYAQAWLWEEAVAWLGERGWRLAAVAPGFACEQTGVQLQFDGVFLPQR